MKKNNYILFKRKDYVLFMTLIIVCSAIFIFFIIFENNRHIQERNLCFELGYEVGLQTMQGYYSPFTGKWYAMSTANSYSLYKEYKEKCNGEN